MRCEGLRASSELANVSLKKEHSSSTHIIITSAGAKRKWCTEKVFFSLCGPHSALHIGKYNIYLYIQIADTIHPVRLERERAMPFLQHNPLFYSMQKSRGNKFHFSKQPPPLENRDKNTHRLEWKPFFICSNGGKNWKWSPSREGSSAGWSRRWLVSQCGEMRDAIPACVDATHPMRSTEAHWTSAPPKQMQFIVVENYFHFAFKQELSLSVER